jgi:hypothetical protein
VDQRDDESQWRLRRDAEVDAGAEVELVLVLEFVLVIGAFPGYPAVSCCAHCACSLLYCTADAVTRALTTSTLCPLVHNRSVASPQLTSHTVPWRPRSTAAE